MKNLLSLILIATLIIVLQSCDKSLSEKVFVEEIYRYKDFSHCLVHKTSDCKSMSGGVVPCDTTRIFWTNDWYRYGVRVKYCPSCLNDEEILILQQHRNHQERRYFAERENR